MVVTVVFKLKRYILRHHPSLKSLLKPFERTDSLLCRVELLGGEKVSLIALRLSNSSRVGLCRVENIAAEDGE